MEGLDLTKKIKCDTCPYCKNTCMGKLDVHGNHFHICGMGGNMVYTKPRKEKRYSGTGWIHYNVVGCGLFDTVDEALARMNEVERQMYYERMSMRGGDKMGNVREYHTEPVRGRVQGTGWPIDGHILTFCKWRYDDYKDWHLYDWNDEDDDAVRDTFFQSMVEAGFIGEEDKEEFFAQWKDGTEDTPGSFVLEPDKVEVLEDEQQEGGT